MKKTITTVTAILIFCFLFCGAFAQNKNVVKLDGSSDVLIGNKPEYNFTGSFTMEGKVLVDTTYITLNPRVMSKGNVHFGFSGFMIYYMWASANPPSNPKGFHFVLCCNPSNVEIKTPEVPYCVYNNIAVVFDSASSKMRIYLNGVLEDSVAISAPLTLNTKDVRIGAGDNADFWYGDIDEVRIWNYARSSSQLQALMNDTLPAAYYSTADSGLIGYWRMDVAEDLSVGTSGANDVKDYSVKGNHGDLEGNAKIISPDSADCLLTSVNDIVQRKNSSVIIYPNPFSENTELRIQNAVPITIGNNLQWTIYNLLGEQVRQTIINNQSSIINRESLPSGIYFYKIKNDKETIANGKLVIQ